MSVRRHTTCYLPSSESLIRQLEELKPGDIIRVVRPDPAKESVHPDAAWKTFGYQPAGSDKHEGDDCCLTPPSPGEQ